MEGAEALYREQQGKPLSLFPPEDRNSRKTLESFSNISGLAPERFYRAGKLILATQSQIPLTPWRFKLLADAGVTAMRHDDEIKIMTCASPWCFDEESWLLGFDKRFGKIVCIESLRNC